MSQQLQLRAGPASAIATFIGAADEVVIDTSNKRLVLQDGATAGGFPVAKLGEVVTASRTAVADANFTAVATSRIIAYATLTASRTVTLPLASAFPPGVPLFIVDESGACSPANTIIVNRSGSDTLAGTTNLVLNGAYQSAGIESDGVSKWGMLSSPPNESFATLGVGVSPDASNPLSVRANTSLFNARTVGAGGTGDFRFIVNKEATGNTASYLFQNGFSGRAEVGLTGDDNFHIKVGPAGTLTDAMVIDKTTGIATFSAGKVSAQFGTGNIAYGFNSLISNTTGNYNTASAVNALVSNTTGSQNTAFGAFALYFNTTGAQNTASGVNALVLNTTGAQNTASGVKALYDLSTGSLNTAIGYNTGLGIVSGSNNTVLGSNVGGLAAGLSGAVILATGDGAIRADFGNTTSGVWTLSAPIKTPPVTVATLPSASAVGVGARHFVTDALAPTFGATVVGGGAIATPVYSDSTNWKVG